MPARIEGIDYGFIHIDQCYWDELSGSSLMWRKGSNKIKVIGDIPHGNEILLTKELIEKLQKVLEEVP